MSKRDAQRSGVYAWEDRVVAPADPSRLAFAQADGIVRAIWAELGLRYPPRVERLPRQSRCLADATRLSLRLGDECPSWCLLHELAHSLSSTHEGHGDGHGPRFMGLYLRLLARYLRLPHVALLESASAAGLVVQADAVPIFLDIGPDGPDSLKNCRAWDL